jgi:hypothetical protein
LRESDCWKYLEVRDVPMVPMDPGGTRDDGMLGQIIRHWCSRDTIVGGKSKSSWLMTVWICLDDIRILPEKHLLYKMEQYVRK